MLRKLVRYELKKQLSGSFFVILLILLLVVNVLLNCGIREYRDNAKQYEINVGQEYPYGFWEARKNERIGFGYTQRNYDILNTDMEGFAAAMIEKYGEGVFDPFGMPPEEANQRPGYFGDEWSDASLIWAYSSLLTENEDLTRSLHKAVEAAKAYGREALEDGDNYGIRRNIDIIELYTVPRGQITGLIRGWDDVLFGTHTMLFVFLMILLACGGSFCSEREKQTVLLLHTSKYGKGMTMVAKYLSGAVIAAGLTVIFQLCTVGAVWFKEALVGLDQPAAAMEQTTMLSWPMTVWQYALVHLGCQILAAVLLSVIINSISALSKTSILSYVVGVLSLALLLLMQSAKNEWIMGPLSLADPVRYFDTYCTANIFGFPVLWVIVQTLLWAVIGAACVYAAHRRFHRKGETV